VPPAGQQFAVVVARLDASPDELQAAQACLSTVERRRAERLRFERHRRRFIVARARLRQQLGLRLGLAPEAVDFSYGRNGKPALPDRSLHFSVAHCDDVALFAFSRASEIGVDVEAIRPIREAGAIGAQFFSPRERSCSFLYCWTRKEALAKALGDGLSVPLDQLDVVQPPPGWQLHSFFPLPGFIAAVACQPHG
jgi:4'-phosphopantetheinyl transferase